MFLSRYLEKASGSPAVFGLNAHTAQELRRVLAGGWRAEIHAKRAANCPDIEVMTRRFALMLARNRRPARNVGLPAIVADHGFSSFLRFLIDPRFSEIQRPDDVLAWARARNLATVFLYRDVRAVSSSLAHFLASGKSFLVGIDSLANASDLVTRLYAPVLMEQMRMWRQTAEAQGALCVSYEALMADPARWIGAVCRHGGLPDEFDGAADAPQTYRSWTYNANRAGWASAFSAAQQAELNALAEEAPT